jgi:hypothetical protein
MLPPWASKPEFYAPVLLSFAFFVLSLFGAEIRRFMNVPPNKARNRWNSGILAAYQSELDNVTRLHNNLYEIITYVLSELGSACRISIVYLAVGCLVQILLILAKADNGERQFFSLWFFTMVPTFIAGALMKIGFVMKTLKDYDKNVAVLEAKIAKYKARK